MNIIVPSLLPTLERQRFAKMCDTGVCQTYVNVVPSLKADRRLKNHKLAILRLQQYNRVLLVCLSPMPAAICVILLLVLAEKREKEIAVINGVTCRSCFRGFGTKNRIKYCKSLKRITRTCFSHYGVKSAQSRHNFKILRIALISKDHQCATTVRVSMRKPVVSEVLKNFITKLLLLRAGDIEQNPGPGRVLDIKNLTEDLSTVAHKWFQIGIQLEIGMHVLQTIESDHREQTSRCLTEMLQHWLKNKTSSQNWEVIAEALESQHVNESELAEKIRGNKVLQYERKGHDHQETLTPVDSGAIAVSEQKMPLQQVSSNSDFFGLGLVHRVRLNIDHCSELQSKLYYDSTEMVKKFNRLFISIRKSLDRRKVPLKIVTEVLMGFGSFKSVSQKAKKSAFDEDFVNLQSSSSVMNIMEIVRGYCNFFSYDIIEELITALGDEEDKKDLASYIQEFNDYARRKVCECPSELSPISDSGKAIVYVTLDESYDDCTLSHLRLLQVKLCKILNISSKGVLRLCRIDQGSIILTFSMPKGLQNELFPLSSEQIQSLSGLKITTLKCGHYTYSNSKSLDVHKSPSLVTSIWKRHLLLPASHKVHLTEDKHFVEDADDAASVCTIDSGYGSVASSSISHQAGIRMCAESDLIEPMHLYSNLTILDLRPTTPVQIPRATAKFEKSPNLNRQTAKYKCVCGEKWKMNNSKGDPKTCEGCGKEGIQPYDFIPSPKRVFGDFHCSCGKQWSSGYAWIEWDESVNKWVEKFQECRRCNNEVYPSNVRPLRYTGGNASQKPHDSAACEMCQKYGDCRNLPSTGVEEGEWDDDISVISDSESSSIIDDIVSDYTGQNLNDDTPVNSDDESRDELLSRHLKKLNMK